MTNQNVRVEFKGMIIEGPYATVKETVAKLGGNVDALLRNKYYSESHGRYVDISEMDTRHIENAIKKSYREWASNLTAFSGSELLQILTKGNLNTTYIDLVAEYTKRHRTQNPENNVWTTFSLYKQR